MDNYISLKIILNDFYDLTKNRHEYVIFLITVGHALKIMNNQILLRYYKHHRRQFKYHHVLSQEKLKIFSLKQEHINYFFDLCQDYIINNSYFENELQDYYCLFLQLEKNKYKKNI